MYLKSKRYMKKLLSLCSCIIVILLAGCEATQVKLAGYQPFCLNDSILQGRHIVEVKNQTVEPLLSLNGKVAFNDEELLHIYPLISGTIKEVNVQLGDKVTKGQVLARIRSGDIAGYDRDLITAQTNLNTAKRNLAAYQDMYKSGLVSDVDLTNVSNTYEACQAELERCQKVIAINGVSGKSEIFDVVAPCDGFIVEKFVTPNMVIRSDNGNVIFSISDLKNIWVIANVYESDITKVKLGDEAVVTTLTFPDRKFSGAIDKIYMNLDPVNKVERIRIKTDNRDLVLRPEMFANTKIRSSLNSTNKPVVPSNAIIFDNNRDYVLVYKNKCQIVPTEIRKGEVFGDQTVILNDALKIGDKVIADNPLLIFQALNMNLTK